MFDLSEVLKNQNVSESDTKGRDRIEYIGIGQLHDDPNNFYSLDGIDALAGNIEFAGLQQPIRVRRADDGDGYTIVSGHRRAAAIRKIVADGNESFREVPCIVEDAQGSEALRELRLIYANSDTRRMTAADLTKQTERVQELLYKLKEEGVKFPGRMRDYVAEICQISKTKLATLQAIRNKLAPDIYGAYYATGKLNESTAYELSKLPVDAQRQIIDHATRARRDDIRNLYSSTAADMGRDIERFDNLECPVNGGGCVNGANMFEKLYANGYRGYCGCSKGCCSGCSELANCSKSCRFVENEKRRIKAERRAEDEERAEEARRRAGPQIEYVSGLWNRLDLALKAAGLNFESIMCECGFYGTPAFEKSAKLLDGTAEVDASTPTPFGYQIAYNGCTALVSLADELGVSIDWLLGRERYNAKGGRNDGEED